MKGSMKTFGYGAAGLMVASHVSSYFANKAKQEAADARRKNKDTPSALIIGAGFSGMCAAIKLKEAGFNVTIVEKGSDFGGTWLNNDYPGCQCDVPSHDYSYSFELNPHWTTAFASNKEIWAYQKQVAAKYNLQANARFNLEVFSCRWDKALRMWVVKAKNVKTGLEETFEVPVMINAIGPLHFPSYPDAQGVMDGTFTGVEMHSALWKSCDLKDKRVVVVGSAASAVQIVPAITPVVKSLVVLQRTPNFFAPQHSPVLPFSLDYGRWFTFLLATVPGLLRIYHVLVYLSMEVVHWFGIFRGDGSAFAQRVARSMLTRFMISQITKEKRQELIPKVIPTYPVGCKRIIRSEKFLPALCQPHVKLVTHALQRVEPDGVVLSSGEKVEADVIVYATGFKVGSMGTLTLTDAENTTMTGDDLIEMDPETFGGIVMPSAPNCFTILGPKTGLGHQSVLVMVEAQVDYLVSVMEKVADERIAQFSVKKEVAKEFTERIDRDLQGTVWQQCNSWYRNKSGKIPTIWPHSTPSYMLEMWPETDLSKRYDLVFASSSASPANVRSAAL